MSSGMRQTLADFAYYDICQGQAGIGPIGYSSLPVNLVEAAFGQIQKLQQADPSIDLTNLNITTCNNPTFVPGQPNTNYLAQIAPLPPACDKQGAGPCAAGVTPNGIGLTPTSSGIAPGSAAASHGTAAVGGAATSTTGAGGAGSVSSGSTASAAKPAGSSPASTQTSAAGASALAAHGSGGPKIEGTTLADEQAASFVEKLAPWAVVPLLIVFSVPIVIGYRRAHARSGRREGGAVSP